MDRMKPSFQMGGTCSQTEVHPVEMIMECVKHDKDKIQKIKQGDDKGQNF